MSFFPSQHPCLLPTLSPLFLFLFCSHPPSPPTPPPPRPLFLSVLPRCSVLFIIFPPASHTREGHTSTTSTSLIIHCACILAWSPPCLPPCYSFPRPLPANTMSSQRLFSKTLKPRVTTKASKTSPSRATHNNTRRMRTGGKGSG
ncbi:hypothetical protein E2C01_048290 [Portunus trituberculatus]|uniref:Secreted protein n=1 Tax=Portunus trituberculatus TaxID=210409 RepID=A0A5B7G9U0_PORTR|nr:hypothetical protein [Portunus trituberculatus]